MCESSKSERPELESGHPQEKNGSGEKVSRRSFLGGMALGAGCLGAGTIIGEAINKPRIRTRSKYTDTAQ